MQNLFLIFLSLFVQAENKNILEGNVNVGGSISYNYTNTNNYSFFVSPSFQYFIKDHLSVGPVITHSQTQYSFSYAAGATGSFYFGESGSTIFRVTQSLLYSISKPKDVSWSLEDATATTSIAYLYFFNPSTSIGPSFGLNYYLNKDDQSGVVREDQDTTTFFNISFNIHL